MNETRKPNGWRTFAFKMGVLALVWLLLATTFAAQFYWIGKDWPVKISWKASFLRALVEWCPWMILAPAVMWLAERRRFDRTRWLWGVFPYLPACVLVSIAFQGISQFLSQGQGTVVFHEFQHGEGVAGFAKSANRGLIGQTADGFGSRVAQDGVRPTNVPPGTSKGVPPHSPVVGDFAPPPPPRIPSPWMGFLQLAATRAQSTIPIYWAIVCVTWVISYYQQLRVRERHTLELEARLTQANLQTLKTQLQPHFLFNTLNTIASFVRKKPQAAEEMIGSLSEFLRMNLEAAPQHEVPLRRELEFLNLYLEIQQARFGDRLRIQKDIDPATLDATVPTLILQPLVENSVRHGIEARETGGTICIRAVRDADSLRLEVRDDSEGLKGGQLAALREGIGLSNTKARLHELYGDAHRFQIKPNPDGGLTATVEVPWRKSATEQGHC